MKEKKYNLKKAAIVVTIPLVASLGALTINDKLNDLNNNSLKPISSVKENVDIGSITSVVNFNMTTSTTATISITTSTDTSLNNMNDILNDDDVTPYKIQMLATLEGESEKVVWTSDSQTSTLNAKMITPNELKPSTTYKDIKMQLVEDDGTTLIGDPHALDGDDKDITTLNRVNGISDVKITDDTTTLEGFTIEGTVKSTADVGDDEVDSYFAKVYANDETETEIWSGEDAPIAKSGKQSFVVNGLESGKEYKDIKIQLFSFEGKEGLLDEPADVSADTTTLDTIKEIDDVTAVTEGSVTSSSFTIDAKATSTNSKPDVEPYLFKVHNGDGIDYTSSSEEAFKDGFTDIDSKTLTIDSLETGKTYSGIVIDVVTVENPEAIIDSNDLDDVTILQQDVTGIDFVDIPDTGITTTDVLFTLKATAAQSTLPINPYWVGVTADATTGEDGKNSVEWKSSKSYDKLDINGEKIDGVVPGTTYTNINFQLYSSDDFKTTSKLGAEKAVGHEVKIPEAEDPTVEEITSAEIETDSITNTSVNIKMTVSNKGEKINPFLVQLQGKAAGTDFSSNSESQTDLVDISVKFKDLTPGTEYTDLKVQLLSLDGTTLIGKGHKVDDFSTISDSISIESASIDMNKITETSVEIKTKVIDGGSSDAMTDSYYVQFKGKANGSDVDFMSEEQTTTGSEISVKFEGLEPGTEYKKITLQLFKDDKTTPIGSEYIGMSPNEFSTVTPEVKVGAITSVDIKDESITKTSFDFTPISEVASTSNEGVEVVSYKIQALATIDTNEEVIWTSNSLTNTEPGKLTVDGLTAGTNYGKLKFQLTEDDGTTPIGTAFDTGRGIETKPSDSKGVASASIVTDSETAVGFDIDYETLDDTGATYKLQVFANDDETSIWTSEDIIETGTGTVTVDKLDSGTEFKNVKIAAYDGTDIIGDKVAVTDSVTTLDVISGIDNGIIDTDSITGTGFNFTIDIDSSKGSEGSNLKVEPYEVQVVTFNEDTNVETPIWVSQPQQNVGVGLSFTVDGLSPLTVYSDIHFKLLDKDQDPIEGMDIDTETDVTTTDEVKDPSGLPGWAIALIIIGSLSIVGGIAAAIYFLVIKKKD